ncbi:MAG: hypothetical protein LBT86_02985 [Deltaproteobacteria bacterium]|nr:hypothetical protein [Deltaproteobacteria bacterium]
MTIFQFKKRKLIDEVIVALTEEDQQDPIEEIMVISKKASGSRHAFIAGLEKHDNLLEFIGCLEAAKIELLMSAFDNENE